MKYTTVSVQNTEVIFTFLFTPFAINGVRLLYFILIFCVEKCHVALVPMPTEPAR